MFEGSVAQITAMRKLRQRLAICGQNSDFAGSSAEKLNQ
jgi:hypothetical protein